MTDFKKDGHRFRIDPTPSGWRWSVTALDGAASGCGVAATKREAAARIVATTLAAVHWPVETGMTGYGRPRLGRAA